MGLIDKLAFYSDLHDSALNYVSLTLVMYNPFLLFRVKSVESKILLFGAYLFSLWQFRILTVAFPVVLLEMDLTELDWKFWLTIALYFIFMSCVYYGMGLAQIKSMIGVF